MAGEKRTPKRVRRSPEEARALILRAARRVIGELGPDRAGLKDVAAEAGVSHALITHYFGTFEKLIEAALEEQVKLMRAELMERLSAAARTPADLTRFAMETLSDPAHARLVLWAVLTDRMASEDFFTRKDQFPRAVADAIEQNPPTGGSVPRDDIEFSMVLVWCAALGFALIRDHVWDTLGREGSRERDGQFFRFVGELIAERVERS